MAAMETETPEDEAKEEEEEERTFPVMELAQQAFTLQRTPEGSPEHATQKAALMEAVRADKMGPFYEVRARRASYPPRRFACRALTLAPRPQALCERFGWEADATELASLRAANAEELASLEAAHEDSIANHGDVEQLDALFAIARFRARVGFRAEAYAAYDVVLEKPKISTGKKIDATMGKIRVGLFHNDLDKVPEQLESAKKLVEEGGDWDRRNRLKVYESVFCIVQRDMKRAAELLLEGVATFTCVELCTYERFIFYAVVTNLLSLPRPLLKKKIVDGPDILQVIEQVPHLRELVVSFHECEYAAFMRAMAGIYDELLADRYLAQHARYLVREMRVLAYSQFLDAYKSVLLANMAAVFGVGVEFLDKELARFIASGRLNAKVDKVGGMVETNRPDQKNAQYNGIVKQGDLLLNRIQKLARVIDA